MHKQGELWEDELQVKGDLDEVQVGQRLCVIGQGFDQLKHTHVTVIRVTKLFVNSEEKTQQGTFKVRHRRDDGRSTPYSEWGGTRAYTTCQRPKKKES